MKQFIYMTVLVCVLNTMLLDSAESLDYYQMLTSTNDFETYYADPKTFAEIPIKYLFFECINLTFAFEFYGTRKTSVSLHSGGFLSFANFSSSKYIAPLMANFDTKMEFSKILYGNVGDRAIFEWSKVTLRDNRAAGPFTFQVSLWNDGNITIVYKEIPIPVENISDTFHPCKTGISDAYFGKTAQSRPTIIVYNELSIPSDSVKSNTVVHLKPLPTCLKFSTCETCHGATLNCIWCDSFCSDREGMNLYHQEFMERGCLDIPKNLVYCPASENTAEISKKDATASSTEGPVNGNGSVAVWIIIPVVVILLIAVYIYRKMIFGFFTDLFNGPEHPVDVKC